MLHLLSRIPHTRFLPRTPARTAPSLPCNGRHSCRGGKRAGALPLSLWIGASERSGSSPKCGHAPPILIVTRMHARTPLPHAGSHLIRSSPAHFTGNAVAASGPLPVRPTILQYLVDVDTTYNDEDDAGNITFDIMRALVPALGTRGGGGDRHIDLEGLARLVSRPSSSSSSLESGGASGTAVAATDASVANGPGTRVMTALPPLFAGQKRALPAWEQQLQQQPQPHPQNADAAALAATGLDVSALGRGTASIGGGGVPRFGVAASTASVAAAAAASTAMVIDSSPEDDEVVVEEAAASSSGSGRGGGGGMGGGNCGTGGLSARLYGVQAARSDSSTSSHRSGGGGGMGVHGSGGNGSISNLGDLTSSSSAASGSGSSSFSASGAGAGGAAAAPAPGGFRSGRDLAVMQGNTRLGGGGGVGGSGRVGGSEQRRWRR